MTVKQMSQLYYLKLEIKNYEYELDLLHDKMESAAAKMAFSPIMRGGLSIWPLENLVVRMVELENRIKESMGRALELELKLRNFIHDAEDSHMRLILTLRFVDGLSWRTVAMRLGGGNTESGVRKAAYRYLKEQAQSLEECGCV